MLMYVCVSVCLSVCLSVGGWCVIACGGSRELVAGWLRREFVSWVLVASHLFFAIERNF